MATMRSDRKPPLARSPMRLHPRRVLRSTTNTVHTPPGSLTKTRMPVRTWDMEEPELRPEYLTISCELRALAKMVHDEFGSDDLGNVGFTNQSTKISSPLFERGRFYEEYSARRNERLKRKNGKTGDERRTLGVKVESVKRRDTKKLEEGLRKSIPTSTPMTGLRQNPRYLLRSSTREGIKKPPLPVSYDKSVACSAQKTASRRVRKI